MAKDNETDVADYAAECKGVKVPHSPFLNDKRIARIKAAAYEGDEIAGALSVIEPGDRVLELGAGLGVVGAVIAKNAKPEAVLSFEANPNLIPHIKALHRLNGLDTIMELRQEVLISAPDRPAHMTFHVRNSFLGSSLINNERRQSVAVDVPTCAYDAVCASFKPNVLVMDIEGGELDFLPHADLSGIRAVVIEFHPETYGVEGMRRCKNILRGAGFMRKDDVSTRTVWTCVRGAQAQYDGRASDDIQVHAGAVICPKEGTALSGPGGVQTAQGADVPLAAHWRKARRLTMPFAPPEGPLEQLKGRYLWGGMFYRTFSHFMAESLGRLWALGSDMGPFDGVVFVARRAGKGERAKAFHSQLFEAMGLSVPYHVIEAPTQVETLVVPGSGFGLGAAIEGSPRFRAYVGAHFGAGIAAEGPEKLYISRSKLPSHLGGLVGEVEIEARLRDEGYAIFHPELHDIATQIAHYRAAKQVIACDGSALHLLAFCARPDQQIAMICRRVSSASTLIEQHITSFAGRAPLVVSALRGQWQPENVQRARMFMGVPDMGGLHKALCDGGFISGKATWAEVPGHYAEALAADGFVPVG